MNAGFAHLNPLWRKVLADVWDGKLRTLLVVTSIAVGVFAIGIIASSYVILRQDLNLSYGAIHPANIEMATTPFNDEFVAAVERLPGVAGAEGRQLLRVRVSKDGVAWQNLDLLATRTPGAEAINQLKPLKGAAVPGEHELLIAYEQMRDTGLRTGDWLQVQLADGSIRMMRIAGEVADQTRAHDPMGAQRGYISQDTLAWLGEAWHYNRLLVTVSDRINDEGYIQSVADGIKDKVEKSHGEVYHSAVFRSDEYPMAAMALAMLGILGVLGVLVLFLSSSLIINTLNSLFAQHLRQIGVMKLVGARGGQVMGAYLMMILVYALLAFAIAAPLGAWGGYQLSLMMAGMFNATLQGFRFVPQAIALQAVIAICVPLAAGFLPVRSGSRISVRRALSSTGMGEQGAEGEPGRLHGLAARLFARPVLLSIRNTFRRKGRLALTLFTLTMAGAIFIAVFNVRVSMDAYMDQLMRYFMADVTLNFNRSYRVERVTQVLEQLPGVTGVEAWSGAGAEILDENDNLLDNLTLQGPPANTQLLKADMVAGRWIQPGDERALAISNSIYTLLPDLKPGDKLRLRVAGGKIEPWTVVGVFSYSQMFGDSMGYVDYPYLASLLGAPGQASSYRLDTDAHTLESQQALCDEIDTRLRQQNFQVQNVEAGMVTRKQASITVGILMAFLLIMALLTAVVGSIGLTGTMSMNVMERTREIGVMRAIGAVNLAIVKSVMIEGLLIGLISWLLGWALSYPISFLLLRIISTAMQSDPIALAFTLQGVFAWLAVVLVLSAIASLLPARNAARLTIREVLAYE